MYTKPPYINGCNLHQNVMRKFAHVCAPRKESTMQQCGYQPTKCVRGFLTHGHIPKWNAGKWQHGQKPAVFSWWSNFDPLVIHSCKASSLALTIGPIPVPWICLSSPPSFVERKCPKLVGLLASNPPESRRLGYDVPSHLLKLSDLPYAKYISMIV